MSRYYEFEGKNIDAAVRNACDILKILKENIKYEIVQPGSSGFFGIVGRKKAKIRVMRIQDEHADTGEASDQKSQTPSADKDMNSPQLTEDDAEIAAGGDDAVPTKKDNISDPLELAQTALRRILDFITDNATITVEKREPIELMVSGPHPGVIIGKHGQTLEAIQYLVEKMVSRKCKKHIRLHIDIEQYLKKRKDNLIKLALRLSEKTKLSGKPVTIGVMNAQERRIVHIALRDKAGVRTQSIGSGIMRKLVIYPKKNNRRAK